MIRRITRLYNTNRVRRILRQQQYRFNSSQQQQQQQQFQPPQQRTGFMTKLLGLTGAAAFAWILYLNVTRDERFNQSLEVPAESEQSLSSYYENDPNFEQFQNTLRQVTKSRDNFAVVNLNTPDQNELVKQWVVKNQSNTMRDLDLIYINSQDVQSRFMGNLGDLHTLLRNHENNARMRILKGTNKNRQLVLVFGDANAAENNVLDVLKLYAKRWSSDPERYGVTMVFAGTTLKMKFLKDNVVYIEPDKYNTDRF
jgi:hypothetical protein